METFTMPRKQVGKPQEHHREALEKNTAETPETFLALEIVDSRKCYAFCLESQMPQGVRRIKQKRPYGPRRVETGRSRFVLNAPISWAFKRKDPSATVHFGLKPPTPGSKLPLKPGLAR